MRIASFILAFVAAVLFFVAALAIDGRSSPLQMGLIGAGALALASAFKTAERF